LLLQDLCCTQPRLVCSLEPRNLSIRAAFFGTAVEHTSLAFRTLQTPISTSECCLRSPTRVSLKPLSLDQLLSKTAAHESDAAIIARVSNERISAYRLSQSVGDISGSNVYPLHTQTAISSAVHQSHHLMTFALSVQHQTLLSMLLYEDDTRTSVFAEKAFEIVIKRRLH
jgi:hypothetical protein